jgi:hypothetical protein
LKGGLSTTHPLRTDELRMISAWLKERARMKPPAAVKTFFISERRKPLYRSAVNFLLQRYSRTASLPLLAPRDPSLASTLGENARVRIRTFFQWNVVFRAST